MSEFTILNFSTHRRGGPELEMKKITNPMIFIFYPTNLIQEHWGDSPDLIRWAAEGGPFQ